MPNIFDLANAFLAIEPMTNKKLQKLCYYAKAWYLALNDENLVDCEFQAWIHGPVCCDLYHRYKGYGFEKIPAFNGGIDAIPEEFASFAKEVFESYGELSGDELEDLTHTEAPWINARGERKPWERCEEVISEDDMKSFYRKMIREE